MEEQRFKYAAHYRGCIWGLGFTSEDAIEEALLHLVGTDLEGELTELDLKINPISSVLSYYVEKHGGENVPYVYHGNTMYLLEGKTVY